MTPLAAIGMAFSRESWRLAKFRLVSKYSLAAADALFPIVRSFMFDLIKKSVANLSLFS